MHIFLTASIPSGYVVWEPRLPCEAVGTLPTQARASLKGELLSEVRGGVGWLSAFVVLDSYRLHYQLTSLWGTWL